MSFIDSIIEKLVRHPKRIVFPDGNDERVLKAAERLVQLKAGLPILLGNKEQIATKAKSLGVDMKFVMVINPAQASDLEMFCAQIQRLERYKKLKITSENARELVLNPNYFAALMLQFGQVDALVGGATGTAGSILRPLLQVVKPMANMQTITSAQIMELPNTDIGENGVLFLADCGVVPNPDMEQLGAIAFKAGLLARQIFGFKPRVAMLSFSTYGSARTPETEKVLAATAIAQQRAEQEGIDMDIDGEMQVDAALLPDLAAVKCPVSSVAGKANVLVFPDLNSGNIASKLLHIGAGGNMYGQVMLGLSRPAVDLSRGASTDEIVALAAIAGLQAIEYRKLYPVESME